jgi:hypothetical protein
MSQLKYWDVATGAYITIPGAPGPQGIQGPAGQAGPAGAPGPQGPSYSSSLTWTALPYAATWSDYGSGWRPGQYAKDAMGIVYLRGLVTSTSAIATDATSLIATLPSGFRPANGELFQSLVRSVSTQGYPSRVHVLSDGTVVLNNSTTQATVAATFASLSDIQFIADGS